MKRYRWFVHKSTFDTELENENIDQNDICFILDRLRLYTRSNSFDFSNRPIYQGETNNSDTAGTWTAAIDGITELYDGLTIKVRLVTSQGASYSTLNVNGLGAEPVWFRYGVPLDSASTPIGNNLETIMTYRTFASSSAIMIDGNLYLRGWVMSSAIPVRYGSAFTVVNGTLGLNYGTVGSSNTGQPVTGAAVYDAIPKTYISGAEVDGTELTLIQADGTSNVVYDHPNHTATTISAGNGKVLESIVVNSKGHVTSVTGKTLTAVDIPSLSWNKITSDKPTTLSGYGITDAKIQAGVITLGSNTITPVTDISGCVDKTTAQTINGTKTFTQTIQGNLSGNAATATVASSLAPQGTSDYFLMADGSLSNGYDLLEAMVDQFSADNVGTLTTLQVSSTVYDDIFE